MKKKKLLCFVLLLVLGMIIPVKAEAATKYEVNHAIDSPVKIGKATFTSKQYKIGNQYYYKIVMTKNGKSKTILDRTEAAFLTNGIDLFYVKCGSKINEYEYKKTIYKYHIKTGKKTRIVSGKEFTVCGCSGNYLFCGTDYMADGVEMYSLNLKTKKKKKMVDAVGSVCIANGRVITGTNSGAVDNLPIYSFKLNGSGKVKITDGILLKAEKNKIYYAVVNETYDKYRVYTCSLVGKNKKAISGWSATIPSKYLN